MSVTNDLRELLQRYPYPHCLPDVLEAVQAHAAMLQAGYARIIEQAQATQATHDARYDVWASMACDMALEGVVSRNPRKFCRKRSQAKFPAAETIRHGLSRMFWLCKPGISANGVPVP